MVLALDGAGTGVEQPVLAVDGETLLRSHDGSKGLGALHSVSVWASEVGLSLGKVACAEKSNEIIATPELLSVVDIQGAMITIDAMGTQKGIAEQFVAECTDYVLVLKGNQGSLYQAISDYVDEQLDGDIPEVAERTTVERGLGREDSRTYVQLPAPEGLPGRARWKDLKSVGVVTSRRLRDGKEAVEVRYYIGSLEPDVPRLARSVRDHWGIENGSIAAWT
jgi:predicted transposase YbfD/YdcC